MVSTGEILTDSIGAKIQISDRSSKKADGAFSADQHCHGQNGALDGILSCLLLLGQQELIGT